MRSWCVRHSVTVAQVLLVFLLPLRLIAARPVCTDPRTTDELLEELTRHAAHHGLLDLLGRHRVPPVNTIQ